MRIYKFEYYLSNSCLDTQDNSELRVLHILKSDAAGASRVHKHFEFYRKTLKMGRIKVLRGYLPFKVDLTSSISNSWKKCFFWFISFIWAPKKFDASDDKVFFLDCFCSFQFWEQELGQVLRHSSQASVFLNQWAQGSTPTRFFLFKRSCIYFSKLNANLSLSPSLCGTLKCQKDRK